MLASVQGLDNQLFDTSARSLPLVTVPVMPHPRAKASLRQSDIHNEILDYECINTRLDGDRSIQLKLFPSHQFPLSEKLKPRPEKYFP